MELACSEAIDFEFELSLNEIRCIYSDLLKCQEILELDLLIYTVKRNLLRYTSVFLSLRKLLIEKCSKSYKCIYNADISKDEVLQYDHERLGDSEVALDYLDSKYLSFRNLVDKLLNEFRKKFLDQTLLKCNTEARKCFGITSLLLKNLQE